MGDLDRAIDEARALNDPLNRAKALGDLLADKLPTMTKRLQQERRAAVLEAHEGGMSFADIGEVIGQHRSRVAQIAYGISGGKKKPQRDLDANPELVEQMERTAADPGSRTKRPRPKSAPNKTGVAVSG